MASIGRSCKTTFRSMSPWRRGAVLWPLPGFWPVFCASLADVFDNEVEQGWRYDLFDLVRRTPNLTWQIVTKRVGNVARMVPAPWMRDGFPPNVWMIATVCDQEEFDRDWPKLRAIPARVRGLSVEPMLGRIHLPDDVTGNLHWAIFGGESAQPGGEPRPFQVWWAEDAIAQCRYRGVAPFIKQLGSRALIDAPGGQLVPARFGTGKRADMGAWPVTLRVREFPA